MKMLLASLVLLASTSVFAGQSVTTTSCEDFGVSLNSVLGMKTYANSDIKIFEVDLIEPAVGHMGVAVAIDRGQDLSEMESFCRYIPYLSGVELQSTKSAYDVKSGILTLSMKVLAPNRDAVSVAKTLVLSINKGAATEEDLVKAEIK